MGRYARMRQQLKDVRFYNRDGFYLTDLGVRQAMVFLGGGDATWEQSVDAASDAQVLHTWTFLSRTIGHMESYPMLKPEELPVPSDPRLSKKELDGCVKVLGAFPHPGVLPGPNGSD